MIGIFKKKDASSLLLKKTKKHLNAILKSAPDAESITQIREIISIINKASDKKSASYLPELLVEAGCRLSHVKTGHIDLNRDYGVELLMAAKDIWDGRGDYTKTSYAEYLIKTHCLDMQKADEKEIKQQATESPQKALASLNRNKNFSKWAKAGLDLAEELSLNKNGDASENYEKAISLCREVSSLAENKGYAYEWAMAQKMLGDMFFFRINGDESSNQETAIVCFENALKKLIGKPFRLEYAETRLLLGMLFNCRIQGDHSDNIEKAIDNLFAALEILTAETDAEAWASIMETLGNLHYHRAAGDADENLIRSIAFRKAALDYYKKETHPLEYYRINKDIGTAYMLIMPDGNNDYSTVGLEYFDNAISALDKTEHPAEWAAAFIALGDFQSMGARAYIEENKLMAVECYSEALSVLSRDEHPILWADAMHRLGDAYSRITGNTAVSRHLALKCFDEALSVFDKEHNPLKWAMVMISYGNYGYSATPSLTQEDIGAAIGYYECALEVISAESDRRLWANVNFKLGSMYDIYYEGDIALNRDIAIEHYKKALSANNGSRTDDIAVANWYLGYSYFWKISGDRKENLLKALSHIETASLCNQPDNDLKSFAFINFTQAIILTQLSKIQKNPEQKLKAFEVLKSSLHVIECKYSDISAREDRDLFAEEFSEFTSQILSFLKSECTLDEALSFVESCSSKVLVRSIDAEYFKPSEPSPEKMEIYWRFANMVSELKNRFGFAVAVKPQAVKESGGLPKVVNIKSDIKTIKQAPQGLIPSTI